MKDLPPMPKGRRRLTVEGITTEIERKRIQRARMIARSRHPVGHNPTEEEVDRAIQRWEQLRGRV